MTYLERARRESKLRGTSDSDDEILVTLTRLEFEALRDWLCSDPVTFNDIEILFDEVAGDNYSLNSAIAEFEVKE